MKLKLKFIVLIVYILPFLRCGAPGLDRTRLDLLNFYQLTNPRTFSDYSLRGEVNGLLGEGLQLNLEIETNQSVTTEPLSIIQGGSFSFKTSVNPNYTYNITILRQPTNPKQICEVGGGSGSVGNSDITNILVQCGESLDLPLPVFSPLPGEFFTDQSITISSSEALAKIFYTLDGSNPACNSDGTGVGTEYTTPILLTQPSLPGVDIRAIVCLNNKSSNVQTGFYRITGVLALPTFTPSQSNQTNPSNISIASADIGSIYFTSDNSTPTSGSTLYTTALENTWILAGKIIKAIATKSGLNDSPIASAIYSFLPFKTGSTDCWDESGTLLPCPVLGLPSQDADLQSGIAQNYTDNADGTVLDNITGIVWQKCTKGSNTPTDCAGSTTTDQETWDIAETYCNSLTLAGRTWHLPSKDELETIINFGRNSPAIDTATFPVTRLIPYWNSNTVASDPTKAWYVHFNSGAISNTAKTTPYYVRCASGSTRPQAFYFKDNLDGSVKDNKTGLIWQKCTRGSISGTDCTGVIISDQVNWSGALNYCNDLILAGRSDWRLPNVLELNSLMDSTKSTGALIDTTAFPETMPSVYWSSTTRTSVPTESWYVNFSTGNAVGLLNSGNSYIRCVTGS